MPLVRIDLLEGNDGAYLDRLSNAVHRALVETLDVADDDRFHLITQHSKATFRYAGKTAAATRSDALVVISITLNAGRSPEKKRAFFSRTLSLLEHELELRPDDVFIGLVDVDPDNWYVR
jgi:phenylpyruvate tautomerase PptA (4-oxalocrotonate tautomerase family)